jgi:hypothetical protein
MPSRATFCTGEYERDYPNYQENDQKRHPGPIVLLLLLKNRATGSFVFMPRRGKDGVDSRDQTSSVIPHFKMRFDFVFGYLFASGIRQDAFQTVTNLQKHLVVLNENKKNSAVIRAL